MISLDLDKGKYFNDKKTKDHLASNPIYKEFASNPLNYLKVLKVLKKNIIIWTGIKTTSISCRFKY